MDISSDKYMSCMNVMKGQTPFCDTCKEFIFFATKVF